MVEPVQRGWSLVARSGGAVATDRESVLTRGTVRVEVVRFHADVVRFALHTGSQDPGPAARLGLKAGSTVLPSERKHLLGAFNGGFTMHYGVGGYEQERHVVQPLRAGFASLVLDRFGGASVTAWPPKSQKDVFSVRQNLTLLVDHGRPTSQAAAPGLWGEQFPAGSSLATARSAVGTDSTGNLLVAGSMVSLPRDLASVLAAAGAVRAMELDINPAWVHIAVATHAGGALHVALTGQQRPADHVLTGSTRDFIVALERTPAATASGGGCARCA